MIKIIKERRSVRTFLDKDVNKELIKKIIEAGIWAPSACNLQPWLYVIIKDKKKKNDIVKKGKTQKFLLNAPVVIAVFYDSSVVKENNANIQSVAASIQNMLLYAHYLGLGGLWMAACENPKYVKSLLKIPKRYKFCAFVLLGYSKVKKILAPKRDYNIIHYETFSGKDYVGNTFLKNWTFSQILQYQEKIARRGFRLEDVRLGEIKEIIDNLHLKDKILDYSNFGGNFLAYLQKKYDVRGHFYSEAIKNAALLHTKGLKDKNLLVGTTDKKFNYVCSFYKLEHIPNKKEFLRKLKSFMKQNSKLIIVTVNKYSWRGLLDFYFRKLLRRNNLGDRFYSSLVHIGPWEYLAKNKVVKLLESEGFKDIKLKGKLVFPYYEIKESSYKKLKFIVPFLGFGNKLCDILGLSNIFGKSLVFVCKK